MKKKELLKRIEELTNVVREMHENNVDVFDVTKTLKDRLFIAENKIEALEDIVKPIADLQKASENAKGLEEDKFAELKEAHKNGAVIQFKNDNTDNEWKYCKDNYPKWNANAEYRIKPEEPKQYTPKIGDVVKAWVNSKEDMVIGVIANTNLNENINDFDYYISLRWYPNVEPITDENIIKLFN